MKATLFLIAAEHYQVAFILKFQSKRTTYFFVPDQFIFPILV
jgi:hypothetical protein